MGKKNLAGNESDTNLQNNKDQTVSDTNLFLKQKIDQFDYQKSDDSINADVKKGPGRPSKISEEEKIKRQQQKQQRETIKANITNNATTRSSEGGNTLQAFQPVPSPQEKYVYRTVIRASYHSKSEDEKKKIKNDYKEGMPIEEIGTIHNVSINSVIQLFGKNRKLREIRKENQSERLREKNREQIQQRYLEVYSDEEEARAMLEQWEIDANKQVTRRQQKKEQLTQQNI